jgi:hypothetical protein
MIRRAMLMMMCGLCASLMTGCGGGAVLRGKVVSGPQSMVMVVTEDDPRLAGPGLDGVTIKLTLDPRSLGRKPLGAGSTYGDGTFAIPINEFGAGLLEYEVGALARAEGHQYAEGYFKLPPPSQRVLIVMAKGHDTYREFEDPRKDLERYGP